MRETTYREQRSTLLANPFYALTSEKGGVRRKERKRRRKKKNRKKF